MHIVQSNMNNFQLIDGTLTGTNTPGQSGCKSNEEVFHTTHTSRTGALPSDAV